MENELTRWKGQSFFTPRRLPSSLCHFTSLSLVSEGNTDRSLLHSLTLFPYCPCTPPRSRRRLVSFVKLWTRSAPQLLQSFSQLDWFLPVFVTPFVLVPIHFLNILSCISRSGTALHDGDASHLTWGGHFLALPTGAVVSLITLTTQPVFLSCSDRLSLKHCRKFSFAFVFYRMKSSSCRII